MPEHSITDFRGRNKYGHRSKNDKNKTKNRNRSSSPPRKLGNIKSHKTYCTFCSPELASRMERHFNNIEENNEIQKDIKKFTIKDLLDLYGG
jgi:hypothetical protein